MVSQNIKPQTYADTPSLTLGEEKGAARVQSEKANVSEASSAQVCG